VLDCCFSTDDSRFFSGSVDTSVSQYVIDFAQGELSSNTFHYVSSSSFHSFDVRTGAPVVIGNHDKAVKCVRYSSALGLLVSGSWDTRVNVWDVRAGTPLVGSFEQLGKVYAMDISSSGKLVVATSDRHVSIYDLRNLQKAEQQRESSLAHQTRCLSCFPNGTGNVRRV